MDNYSRGMTLVEVIIYIALLSVLLSVFISYAYAAGMENIKLMNSIEDAYN